MELKKETYNDITTNSELRIYDYLLTHVNSDDIVIEHMDYTTMGIKSLSPKYKNGGVKWYCDYVMDDSDDNIVIRKEFEYVDNGAWIKHTWFKHDGTIGIYKTEFKPLNPIEIGKIKKNNRERAINFLMVNGDQMRATADSLILDMFSSEAELNFFKNVYIDIADSIDILLNFFKYEIDVFILRGSTIFYDKINDIIDGTIVNSDIQTRLLKYVESAPSAEYPTVKRVKDSIFEQITDNY